MASFSTGGAFEEMLKAPQALKLCGGLQVEYECDPPVPITGTVPACEVVTTTKTEFKKRESSEFGDVDTAYLGVNRDEGVYLRGYRDNDEHPEIGHSLGTLATLKKAFE